MTRRKRLCNISFKKYPSYIVGKEAPNYDYDDPIFKELGVTSMTTPRPDYDDPKQAEWDTQYKEILKQLNEKSNVYNEEAKRYNNSIGAIESKAIKNYTIIRTTTHTSEKQVRETKAGTISSGKDMTLTGNVTNENSRITAGSTLNATGGTLDNIAEKNQVQKITFGTTQESYTAKRHWPHKSWRRHYRDQIFMTPQKELNNPTALDVGAYEGNTGKNPSKEDITQTMRDNVQNNLNPFTDGKETNPGSTAGKETGGSLSFIPDSSLYQLHPEEKAKYLIESDPAFTNKKKFLSSDYMYNQLLWDNDKVNKRLGDGFYEQELIRNQVTQLTGMRYLNGYNNDEDEYKALMDAGIAYAKEYNLKPGISLTKEQMASLTSDMVWLETTTVTVNGKTYDVLYPHVYLKSSAAKTLTEDGSIISANTLITDTKDTLINQGTIFGNDISFKASQDIIHSGIIEGENKVFLDAGRNITMKDTIQHGKNQDILDTTAGIAVKGKEGVLLMQAGQDITMTGATLAALGENGSMILSAGQNLTMDTGSLEAKKDMTENSDNYIRTYRKTETANTLTAGKDISLISGNDLKARNTTVASETGAITAKAGNDVTIENGYNESIDDYGLKYKESGFLSHKTTTIKSHDESKTATGSMISGDKVSITSGGNTTITASNVVGTNDVSITSGKDTTITSTEEVEQHDYEKRVKKSGLLGGGLGFTIGSEKRNDQYKDADITQQGSTIGSIAGNVTIEANKDVHVNASDIIAGKDIFMMGENVDISSKDNVYHSDEKHEYKKSGLTVSVGGATIEAINSVVQPITRASEVKDKRLAGLYAVKAGQEANQIAKTYQGQQDVIDSLYDKAGTESDLWAKGKDWKEADQVKDNQLGGKNTFTLNVGFGSSHSQAESHSETKEAAGSHVSATGDVTIKATKEDIRIKGSQVTGENVTLDAKKDIDITATETSNNTKENTKSSGASIGASIGVGGLQGVSVSYSKSKRNVKENETTYEKSQVTANNDLNFISGKDTTISGSEMAGNKVTGDVGGNLSIETKQDRKTYEEKNTSTGLSVNYGAKNGKTSASGGASKDTIHSDYESATDQAGILAGENGFDITVKNNTNLKGGVIDSNATKDKNTLTTGTLSWKDTENKADYKAGGMGVSYAPNDKSSELNQRGLTPNLTPTVKDKADSTTKSAVAEGTINITDKEQQKQDISSLNRDTKHSLNQLQEIFDKTQVEERQELRGLLEQYGNEFIHQYAENRGWKDGSSEKTALHALWSGLMSQMSGGNALSGSLSGGVNEYVLGYLEQSKGRAWMLEHPDVVQAISTGLGATLGTLTGDMDNSAYTAHMGAKWNQYESYPNMKEWIEDYLQSDDYNQLSVGVAKVIYTDDTKQHGVIIIKDDSFGNGRIIDLDSITGAGDAFVHLKDNGKLGAYTKNKEYHPTGDPNAPKSYYNFGEQDGYVLNSSPLYNSDINRIAWDKSQEILASKGLSWGAANWFEASCGYLSRQEAEKEGANISNKALKVWGQIAYLKEVVGNHQRFDTLQDALKADGYDTIPISAGIVTAGVLSRFSPGVGFIGGVLGGIGSNIYSNQKKEELKKVESDNSSNSDNNIESKNSEV